MTNDVLIAFDGTFNAAAILLNLSSGTIYQDALGGNTPPNPAIAAVIPSLRFDTFLALGGIDSNTLLAVSTAGGAVDLGGGVVMQFNTTELNATWFAPGGTNAALLTAKTDWPIARVSLSDDAAGSWAVLFTADGGASRFEQSGQIVDGPFQSTIPEPMGLSFLGLGVAGWVMRRRRLDRTPTHN